MPKTAKESISVGEPGAAGSSKRPLVIAGCFALLVLLGWIDYITGYELGFFVFYSVPVGLAAWYAGRWPAVLVALGASVTWWLADYYSGAKYSARFYYYWNGTIHFLAFVINAVTIAKIKTELDRRQALGAELEIAHHAVRELETRIADCPICRRRGEARHPAEPKPSAIAPPEDCGSGQERTRVDSTGGR